MIGFCAIGVFCGYSFRHDIQAFFDRPISELSVWNLVLIVYLTAWFAGLINKNQ